MRTQTGLVPALRQAHYAKMFARPLHGSDLPGQQSFNMRFSDPGGAVRGATSVAVQHPIT
jgi:hypothetical protein